LHVAQCYCILFAACCLLQDVRCMVSVACSLFHVACCRLYVVCFTSFVACCRLPVAYSLLYVVCCLLRGLIVDCCVMFVACGMLQVARCMRLLPFRLAPFTYECRMLHHACATKLCFTLHAVLHGALFCGTHRCSGNGHGCTAKVLVMVGYSRVLPQHPGVPECAAAAARPRAARAVLSCAGAYVSGAAGSNECPAGSVRIETGAACRAAAAAAGKTPSETFAGHYPTFPRGCFYYSSSDTAFFNTHEDGDGDYDFQLLCAAVVTTGARPPHPCARACALGACRGIACVRACRIRTCVRSCMLCAWGGVAAARWASALGALIRAARAVRWGQRCMGTGSRCILGRIGVE
jgi:hypothetical protein